MAAELTVSDKQSIRDAVQGMHSSRTRWLAAPAFDTLFFQVPLILGFVYFGMMLALKVPANRVWVFLPLLLLAYAHQAPTFFFYLDRKNLSYYAGHATKYFIVPILLLGSAVGLSLWNDPGFFFVFFVMASWQVWHTIRQNIGIATLYHRRNPQAEMGTIRKDRLLIYGASILFCGLAGARIYSAESLAATHSINVFLDGQGMLLNWLAVGIAGGCLIGYGAWIFAAGRFGGSYSYQNFIFLATSVATFAPLLYIPARPTPDEILLVQNMCLVAHYLQYLGLTWMLQRNKYSLGMPGRDPDPAIRTPLLSLLARNAAYLALGILLYGGVMTLIRATAANVPPEMEKSLLTRGSYGLLYGVAWVHFYLDGLFWTFRNPHVRETVAPFLAHVPGRYTVLAGRGA
ncbi:MAG: hypothetical protein O7H41_04185 [Planctomycetota bacterium]|nr:hypothetical protein [Planctomycetota bacterium]